MQTRTKQKSNPLYEANASTAGADVNVVSKTPKALSFDGNLDSHRLINGAQLREILPVSQMSIWRWERQGIIPKHINIGGRNYWRLSQILEFIEVHSNQEAVEIGGDINAP